jgi:indole-3-glycerol phosphate synthase
MKAEAQASGVLAGILRETERRVAVARAERASIERLAAKAPAPPDFVSALASGERVAVIAEIKRRSPSAGALRPQADVASLAESLEEAGATALSVLTEGAHFGGSLADLSSVSSAVRLPVLRKDFILDPVQVYEARAYGAAAVLLIVRILEPGRLAELVVLARDLGLASLVEVHHSGELAAALAAGPGAVGVNARDLDSLALDAQLFERVVPAIPEDRVAVAESGLKSRIDVERAAACGADAVLVGTAISGSEHPAAALHALAGVSRRERPGRGVA